MSNLSRQLLKRIREHAPIPFGVQEVSYAGPDTPDARREVSMLAARRSGCTCKPTLYPTAGGNMLVGHQEHCALLRIIEGQN